MYSEYSAEALGYAEFAFPSVLSTVRDSEIIIPPF